MSLHAQSDAPLQDWGNSSMSDTAVFRYSIDVCIYIYIYNNSIGQIALGNEKFLNFLEQQNFQSQITHRPMRFSKMLFNP